MNSLNPHFGTADDLKALSRAVHERAMYLMVDIVVNQFVVIINYMRNFISFQLRWHLRQVARW